MTIKDIFKDPNIDKGMANKNQLDKKLSDTSQEKKEIEKRSKSGERYTENEIMVRLKFIIGCCLAFTLIGIVFTVLYSIMFITQPLNAISPIDQKFFELIIPVATFLCGTLSGIMLAGSGKEAAMAGAAAQANAMNGLNKPMGMGPRPLGPSPIQMNDMPMRGDMGMDPDPMPGMMQSSPTPGARPIGKPAIKPISLD